LSCSVILSSKLCFQRLLLLFFEAAPDWTQA
jgi:hypothetical protein